MYLSANIIRNSQNSRNLLGIIFANYISGKYPYQLESSGEYCKYNKMVSPQNAIPGYIPGSQTVSPVHGSVKSVCACVELVQ